MFHYQVAEIIKHTNPENVALLVDGWAFGLNYCSSINEGNVGKFSLKFRSDDYGGFRGKFLLLEDLSREHKISYNVLEELYSKATELYLNDHVDESKRDDALVVKVCYEEGGKTLEYKKFIHFSSIPFSGPRNRLCQKFKSENFIIVKLLVPSINMKDITDNINNPMDLVENDIDLDENEIRCKLLESLINQEANDELKKLERNNMYKNSMNIDLFDGPLKIFDKEFEFLCCNSTGALVQKYIFVNKEIKKDVINWALDRDSEFNKKTVFLKEKPMVEPLRLSLLNSLCVPTVKIDGEYVFSVEESGNGEKDVRDGCGLILSNTLIDSIIESYNVHVFLTDNQTDLSYDLPHQIEHYRPCAFQIRYKGFKGVLIYHPYPIEEECDIYFTKSMKKFETGSSTDEILNKLNIVGVSRPKRPTILSSELIYLFSGLCKNREKMVYYLEQMLILERLDIQGNHLSEIFRDASIAERLVKSRGETVFETMSEENILSEEQIILGTTTFSNYLLTLNVPMPLSAHLYGVADFTNSLNPGEVFIQLTDSKGKRSILDQDVLMTKTPALFRSDLRKFKAVNCEKLQHLYDVVVFSTRNPILLEPSVMAGADLDGDHFYVFYDTDLIENIELFETEEKQDETVQHEEEREIESTVTSILLSPLNTFTYCTLNHLLEIRRRFIDDFDTMWATNEEKYNIIESIGMALTQTYDAPKHGKWREWKSMKDMLNSIPKFPHYHTSLGSKISTSIYGELYEKILTTVLYSYSEDDPMDFPTDEPCSSMCMNTQRMIELQLFKSENYIDWLEDCIREYEYFTTKESMIKFAVLIEFYNMCDSLIDKWELVKRKFELPNAKLLTRKIQDFSNYIENCTPDNYFIIEHCLRDKRMWSGTSIRYPNIMQCCIKAFKIKKRYHNVNKIITTPQDIEMINSVLKYLTFKLDWIISSKFYMPCQHQVNILSQAIHWYETCLKYAMNGEWIEEEFSPPQISRTTKPHVIETTTVVDIDFRNRNFIPMLELLGWEYYYGKHLSSFMENILGMSPEKCSEFESFKYDHHSKQQHGNHVELYFEIQTESQKEDIIRKLELLFSISGVEKSTQITIFSEDLSQESLVVNFESKENLREELNSYLETRLSEII